jgi:hypothetical protein
VLATVLSLGSDTWTSSTLDVGIEKKWKAVDMSSDASIIALASDSSCCSAVQTVPLEEAIHVSTDGGASWSTTSLASFGGESPGTAFWGGVTLDSSGTKMAAVMYRESSDGSTGFVYTSTDAGATWIKQADTGPSFKAKPIVSSGDGSKIIAPNVFSIWASADTGASWTEHTVQTGVKNCAAISDDGATQAFSIFADYIYLSRDSGETWSTCDFGHGGTGWKGIALSADGGTLAAVSHWFSGTANIDVTHDHCATWTSLPFPVSLEGKEMQSFDMSADGATMAVAVGWSGEGEGLYASTDGGQTWEQLATSAPEVVKVSRNGARILALGMSTYTSIQSWSRPAPAAADADAAPVAARVTVEQGATLKIAAGHTLKITPPV